MNKMTFGITLTIVGMGGTFLTLWILSAILNILKKLFPLETNPASTKGKKGEEPER